MKESTSYYKNKKSELTERVLDYFHQGTEQPLYKHPARRDKKPGEVELIVPDVNTEIPVVHVENQPLFTYYMPTVQKPNRPYIDQGTISKTPHIIASVINLYKNKVRTAASIKFLLDNVTQDKKLNADKVFLADIDNNIDQKGNHYTYFIQSSDPRQKYYECHVDISKGHGDKVKDDSVKVYCSCKDFKFHGIAHRLYKLDDSLETKHITEDEKESIIKPPDKEKIDQVNLLCKHLVAVLQDINGDRKLEIEKKM